MVLSIVLRFQITDFVEKPIMSRMQIKTDINQFQFSLWSRKKCFCTVNFVPRRSRAMTTVSAKATCYHCGESCGTSHEQANGHSFCCAGCKTVYEILNAGDLCQYYDLEERAGIKIEETNPGKWDYLDTPELFRELIAFEDDTTVRVVFQLPQIHCSSCIWLLEHLGAIHQGIVTSEVHFGRKEVDIIFKKESLKLSEVAALLSKLGYPPHISMGEDKKEATIGKAFYYKLGIAGFAFGNIMLLSLPEYLGMSDITHAEYARFFGWINLCLALPVVFYSASDYFKAVIKSARHKLVTVDLPIAIGIATLFLRSAYDIISGSGAGYMDSLAGLVFFLLIGKWYQQKTFDALRFERDYQSYFPLAVTLIKKEEEQAIPIRDLEIGDLIRIRKGELIPADGVLVSGDAKIDYSFVTGEEKAVYPKTGEDMFAGGRQLGAPIEVVVRRAVDQSYLTKIWNQQAFRKPEQLHLVGLIDRVARYFTLAILVIALGTGIYWFVADPEVVWHAVTSVLIIACPCALALSSPFTLGNMMRRFARKGLYVKNTSVIEQMASIDHFVLDKTGTLTSNKNQRLTYDGSPLSEKEKTAIGSLAACSTHPLSQAIHEWVNTQTTQEDVRQFAETDGRGISGVIATHEYKLGSRTFVNDQSPNDNETSSYISIDGELKGRFLFHNQYRTNMLESLSSLRQYGGLTLLSGDSDGERSHLQPYFISDEHMRFGQSPADKMQFVEQVQTEGKSVMMIGDGLNDAGALKQAHLGIAVAENVQQFSPASDAIIAADQLPLLPRYLLLANQSLGVIRWSLVISLLYNCVGLFFAVTGQLSPLIAAILMPLSSVAVVTFAIFATNLLARKTLTD